MKEVMQLQGGTCAKIAEGAAWPIGERVPRMECCKNWLQRVSIRGEYP
jgi:hypothetical protein